jgi:CRISPR-associated protein Cas2
MLVLVTYDVVLKKSDGCRRLRKIARYCKDYGQRVQYSVFECLVDPAQWATLRDKLVRTIDRKCDSLRFYFLGKNWRRRVEHIGAKCTLDLEGSLVI